MSLQVLLLSQTGVRPRLTGLTAKLLPQLEYADISLGVEAPASGTIASKAHGHSLSSGKTDPSRLGLGLGLFCSFHLYSSILKARPAQKPTLSWFHPISQPPTTFPFTQDSTQAILTRTT